MKTTEKTLAFAEHRFPEKIQKWIERLVKGEHFLKV